MPKFEAANAQVLGISVDFNDANKAWAEKLGLTYPLLSDMFRSMSQTYGTLFDDPALLADDGFGPVIYRRNQRVFMIIDKEGVVRYNKTTPPLELVPNDELLNVLKGL